MPFKVKICVWRAFYKALTTQSSLNKRNVDCPTWCPWCETEVKISLHALWPCPFAIQIWSLNSIWLKLSYFNGFTVGGLCIFTVAHLSSNELDIFCYVAWCLCGARNIFSFENIM